MRSNGVRLAVGVIGVNLIAGASVILLGGNIIALTAIYWVELLGLAVGTVCRQLFAVRWHSQFRTEALFRFLVYKRGAIRPSRRLPEVYLRNVTVSVTLGAVVAAVSALTIATFWWYSPSGFWANSHVLAIVAVGSVAALLKHTWTFREYLRTERYREVSAFDVVPGKRLLVFICFPLIAAFVGSHHAETIPAMSDPEVTYRNTATIGLLVVSGKAAVGWWLLRRGPWDGPTETLGESIEIDVLRIPDEKLITRLETNRHAVWLAGTLHAFTGAGFISERAFALVQPVITLGTVGLVFLVALATELRALLLLVPVVVVIALVGLLHFELLLGSVEYRFYETEIVEYDRRLDAVQWRARYDEISSVSVERGVIMSPVWLDTGSVRFERPEENDGPLHQHPRSTIAYVDDPEHAAALLRHRGTDPSRAATA